MSKMENNSAVMVALCSDYCFDKMEWLVDFPIGTNWTGLHIRVVLYKDWPSCLKSLD